MEQLSGYEHRQPSLAGVLSDKIHYACGKNVFAGWLNVDGFDVSFPDGAVDPAAAAPVLRVDLSGAHPFPAGSFRFGYSEEFLEHLTQRESILFLSEVYRTFQPGGVLRLSTPKLGEVMWRHFRQEGWEGAQQGARAAFDDWHHEHYYTLDSLRAVALHLGFAKVEDTVYHESVHPELRGLDTRPETKGFNLFVELTR